MLTSIYYFEGFALNIFKKHSRKVYIDNLDPSDGCITAKLAICCPNSLSATNPR